MMTSTTRNIIIGMLTFIDLCAVSYLTSTLNLLTIILIILVSVGIPVLLYSLHLQEYYRKVLRTRLSREISSSVQDDREIMRKNRIYNKDLAQ